MTIKKLKKWLEKPNNSKAKLAQIMGYHSTETISVWLRSGKIPTIKEKKVKEAIKC